MNYIDQILSNVVKWINEMFSFVKRYSDIFVWGFVAMMVAKLLKVKINYTKK